MNEQCAIFAVCSSYSDVLVQQYQYQYSSISSYSIAERQCTLGQGLKFQYIIPVILWESPVLLCSDSISELQVELLCHYIYRAKYCRILSLFVFLVYTNYQIFSCIFLTEIGQIPDENISLNNKHLREKSNIVLKIWLIAEG